ncbi:uncharacterized protein METZ01_LOCUS56058, partial [marine metagenome]
VISERANRVSIVLFTRGPPFSPETISPAFICLRSIIFAIMHIPFKIPRHALETSNTNDSSGSPKLL